MIIQQNYGSVNGNEPTINIETITGQTSDNYTATFNLSSIEGSSDFEFGVNMFPVISYLSYGAAKCSNIGLTYTFSYNAETQILTLTLSGNTNYVYFPSSPSANNVTVNIYYIS